MKENAASLRVLEKIGLTFIGEWEFEKHPGVLYEMHRTDWERRCAV